MAGILNITETNPTQIEDLLTCPVCQDIFRDPHQLPCGHSLCLECLEGMLRHGPVGQRFSCPNCRDSFGPKILVSKCYVLSDISVDVRNALEDYQAAEVLCDLCPETLEESQRKAVRTCLKCEASLCEGHVRLHQERPVLKGHRLVKLQENLDHMKCSKHKEPILKVLCRRTRTYTCHVCESEKNQYDHIAEASHTLERKLKERMDSHFFKLERNLQDSLKIIKRLRDDIVNFLKRKNSKQSRNHSIESETDFYFNVLVGTFVILWLAMCFHVLGAPSQNDELSKTVQSQQTQLHNLYVYMDDQEGFKQRQGSKETHNDRVQDSATSDIGIRMDRDSASSFLMVSRDLMSVTRAKSRLQVVDNPSRFDTAPQILTTPCFSSGHHIWEVEVEGYWDVAVSYMSIKRKGKDETTFGNNEESWSLTRTSKGDLSAYHKNVIRDVRNTVKYNRVSVDVNFAKGTITFSEVGKRYSQLYKFYAKLTEPVCLGFGLYLANPPSSVTLISSW